MSITKIVFSIFIFYTVAVLLVYYFQEKIIFQGSSLEEDYTFNLETPFEEVFLETHDGYTAHGVLLQAENPRGVILYFHGNRKNITRWGNEANYLLQYGYNVLVMDYRGYGKSTGPRTEENIHKDARLAYDYLKKEYVEDQILIYGRSVGTGVATRLASEVPARSLLLETPYHNFRDMISSRMMILPSKRLIKFEFSSQDYIGRVSCPIHIFHGTDDAVVLYELGQKLSQKAKPDLVNFYTIEGGSHNDLVNFPSYQNAVKEVLTN